MKERISVRPMTRLGWYRHYVKEFKKTGREQAAHLAVFYMIKHLEHDV